MNKFSEDFQAYVYVIYLYNFFSEVLQKSYIQWICHKYIYIYFISSGIIRP